MNHSSMVTILTIAIYAFIGYRTKNESWSDLEYLVSGLSLFLAMIAILLALILDKLYSVKNVSKMMDD